MIELVSLQRCIHCNQCVAVCPTNVFDAVANQAPVIARQEDCQTCFMCEAYCPADALYVAPESHTRVTVNEGELIERDIMGEYRRVLGWGYGRTNNSELDTAHKLRQLPRPYQSQA